MSPPLTDPAFRGRTPVVFAAIECVELARLAEAEHDQLERLQSLAATVHGSVRFCFKEFPDCSPEEYTLGGLPGWTLPIIQALRESGHIPERGFYLIP